LPSKKAFLQSDCTCLTNKDLSAHTPAVEKLCVWWCFGNCTILQGKKKHSCMILALQLEYI